METKLTAMLADIRPLDSQKIEEAARRLDQLTKPKGSLGRMEEIARQLAGIRRTLQPDMTRKAVVVMAADHGVCAEQVSAYPQAVTVQMVHNILQGGAAVNVLARKAKAEVWCVDIGVKEEIAPQPGLIVNKIKAACGNIAVEAAMTRSEAVEAILSGMRIVDKLADEGYGLFATGEMGIGNTTPSAALLCALAGVDAEDAVGRGTGIDDQQLQHKRDVVRRALAVNRPDPADPLDVLHKVGGLDIAGLVGVILGASRRELPVVIDGFISSAAALVAGLLCPTSRDYMIPSHLSGEQGHRAMLQAAGLRPTLTMDMRLGEGTGAVLSFHLLEAALALMNEMATFTSAGVSGAVSDPTATAEATTADGHKQSGSADAKRRART